MPTWIDQLREWLGYCEYPGYRLEVSLNVLDGEEGECVLRACYEEKCMLTNALEWQWTRDWIIPENATKSEVVATAFKCILTSAEHQVREHFKYLGQAVYNPHHNVDDLHKVCVDEAARAQA